MNMRTIKVRAVIPHYFEEASTPVSEIGAGFGSRQPGARLARVLLYRAVYGLLNLRRSTRSAVGSKVCGRYCYQHQWVF